jgi:hypothetical protein
MSGAADNTEEETKKGSAAQKKNLISQQDNFLMTREKVLGYANDIIR